MPRHLAELCLSQRMGEIVYSLTRVEGKMQDVETQLRNPQLIRGAALKEELVGGRVKGVEGEGVAITKVNYFKGNDRSKWKANISTYDLVSLGEVYKGVEIKLRAYGNKVEKLFYINPGARAESIRVKLSGGRLNINKDGELEISTELGAVRFSKPIAYQESGGKEEAGSGGVCGRGG